MESSPVEGSSSQEEEEEESSHFEIKKRKTTSKVWDEFKKIKLPNGRQKAECHHCKSTLSVLASGSTTHLGRHLKGCTQRAIFQKQQQRITLQVVDPDSMTSCDSCSCRWKRLKKRVLSFIHLPPPHRGTDIADNLYKCFKDWNIENKVFTISVNNASNNDKEIKNLRETFSRFKKLPCGARMMLFGEIACNNYNCPIEGFYLNARLGGILHITCYQLQLSSERCFQDSKNENHAAFLVRAMKIGSKWKKFVPY
nr:zinc finger BED domain-containing protein RICESLEEPER 2-like [Tanacetum cinerariifolium]